ncbi:MAG: STIMATE family protein [archaeon]|nr:STIMATE family protein [archaeon]
MGATEAVMKTTQGGKCELFGPFGFFIQFSLGCLSFGTLIVKRQIETPKRSLRIWLLDVSKQGISTFLLHFLNLFLAVTISKENDEDACAWYLDNILLDTTFGVLIQYILVRVLEIIARKLKIDTLISGCYYSFDSNDFTDSNIDYGIWASQMLIWCLISSLAKFINYIIMNLFIPFFRWMGTSILISMQDYPKIELIFVMIIVPLLTACIQYWITDNFLKESDESRLERLARGKDKLIQVGPEYFENKNVNLEKGEDK